MDAAAWLAERIQKQQETLTGLSDAIWEYPEVAFQETRSSSRLKDYLSGQGFTIQERIGGLETDFLASYGTGHPVIAITGEYDALPGLSQAANVTRRKELCKEGPGHGCGHNLLGVGAAGAAVAVKEYLEETGTSGTIRYYGCPAEETGGGKDFMAANGAFDGVDACLTWHPASVNMVVGSPCLAIVMMKAKFKGKAAHAASAPDQGRSALDACELMNVGANYLREHVPQGVRFHYAYLNAGGEAPNVVPENAELLYYVRSSRIKEAQAITQRLKKIAQGAAMMTETKVKLELPSQIADYVPNHTMGEVMEQAFQDVGCPDFSEADQREAAPFCKDPEKRPPLSRTVRTYRISDHPMDVSTDVGNVSQLVPTAQIYTCCFARGTDFHTWQLVAQMKKPAAHKGMLTAAKVMALTAVRLLEHPETIEKAKEELKETLSQM